MQSSTLLLVPEKFRSMYLWSYWVDIHWWRLCACRLADLYTSHPYCANLAPSFSLQKSLWVTLTTRSWPYISYHRSHYMLQVYKSKGWVYFNILTYRVTPQVDVFQLISQILPMSIEPLRGPLITSRAEAQTRSHLIFLCPSSRKYESACNMYNYRLRSDNGTLLRKIGEAGRVASLGEGCVSMNNVSLLQDLSRTQSLSYAERALKWKQGVGQKVNCTEI